MQAEMVISALVVLFAAWATLVESQRYDPHCPVREHPIGCQFMGRLLLPGTSQLWRLPCLRVSCAVDGSVTSRGVNCVVDPKSYQETAPSCYYTLSDGVPKRYSFYPELFVGSIR